MRAAGYGEEHIRHRQLRAAQRGRFLPGPGDGMLTTVAWTLADGTIAYAVEGAIFVTGAAVQWLRDGLGVISSASELAPLAASVDDNGGVFVVPAFTGLGSPWWDPYARGTIVGITRGTTKAHIARAVLEAMTYQTRDAVEAMTSAAGVQIADLRVDGGASAMDTMLQMQADQLGVTVRRPVDQETTALGAAYLAGLAEGVWPSLAAIEAEWAMDAFFEPNPDRLLADLGHETWLRAVERSRDWAPRPCFVRRWFRAARCFPAGAGWSGPENNSRIAGSESRSRAASHR